MNGWGKGVMGLAAVAVVALAGWGGYRLVQQKRVGGPFGLVQVLRPATPPRALVLLLGEGDATARAWSDAKALAAAGAVVGVVDVRRYLARTDDDCGQHAVDLDWLGQRVLRGAGVDSYFEPLLVAEGQGVQLARQALAHTGSSAVRMAVVSRMPEVPTRQACRAGDAATPGMLIDAAPAELIAASVARFPLPSARFRDLPLVELPNAKAQRLVILLSGDGGWQAIDQDIATALHAQGAAVIGWSSLRYFWKAKTPEQTAADLSAVIAEYQRRWNLSRVELVGYSFGADVLPFLYPRLPAAQQAQVQRVALLGLSPTAGFTVRIGGWLGWSGGDPYAVHPQMQAIPAGKVLCVYGEDEDDTLCPALRDSGATVRMTAGGHHFEAEPAQLASWIAGNNDARAIAALSPSVAAPGP